MSLKFPIEKLPCIKESVEKKEQWCWIWQKACLCLIHRRNCSRTVKCDPFNTTRSHIPMVLCWVSADHANKGCLGIHSAFSCSLNFPSSQESFTDVDTCYWVTRATTISSAVGSFWKFICLTFLSLLAHKSIFSNIKI